MRAGTWLSGGRNKDGPGWGRSGCAAGGGCGVSCSPRILRSMQLSDWVTLASSPPGAVGGGG